MMDFLKQLVSKTKPFMFKTEKKESFRDAETVIGPSVTIKGNFNCQGNIIVEGLLSGSISTEGDIFVGEKAKITADITAKNATIGGEIKGNMKIVSSLKISSTAKISGDIECSSLSVEEGAVINGKCSMSRDSKSEKINKEEKLEFSGTEK